jgi:hypothetical protein
MWIKRGEEVSTTRSGLPGWNEEKGPDRWEEESTRPRKSPIGYALPYPARQVMRDDPGRRKGVAASIVM